MLVGGGTSLIGAYLVVRSLLLADEREEDNIKLQVLSYIGVLLFGVGIGIVIKTLF